MQLPLLKTYELDFYDSVRLYLKEESGIFTYLSVSGKLHNISGRIFIQGKFIRLKLLKGQGEKDLPEASKYFFIEKSDIIKLPDPYLLTIETIGVLPDYVMLIDQSDIISIELLVDIR
jgi:hypothetical protein